MEYNTTRNNLVIREYGRNIQKMIEYTIAIEDREKRTQLAKYIVNLMAQMNPVSREMGDVKHKLWDHLHIIADYKLDIDAPFPPPTPQEIALRPERIPYHNPGDIMFRYYGKNIDKIIDKAIEMEDGPEKQAITRTIANHLKKSYLSWNRESVTDELIADHLNTLSRGKLKLSDEDRLSHTNDILARNKKKKFKKEGNGNHNNNLNHNYNKVRKEKKQKPFE
ncbi:MAG: DUF4290 domain-containing protein [Bacteroidetes bacterium]|nr:DUF4290 domain-containing protein [Bacteroidota bacterium]